MSRHLYLGEGKEMLATLIPYFDKNMKVTAYAVASQRDNCLLNPPIFGTSSPNGLAEIEGLEIVHNIGIDTLSPGTNVLIPVTHPGGRRGIFYCGYCGNRLELHRTQNPYYLCMTK